MNGCVFFLLLLLSLLVLTVFGDEVINGHRRLEPNDDNGKYRLYVSYDKKDGHDEIIRRFAGRPEATIKYDMSDLKKIVMTVDEKGMDELYHDENVVQLEPDVKRYPIRPVPRDDAEEEHERRRLQNEEDALYGIRYVQAPQAWPETLGEGIKVCVMDTGSTPLHVDMGIERMTGYESISYPWNQDGDGHGTHVAGTIGAKRGNGATTVVGVAPNVQFFIVRVFDNFGSYIWGSDVGSAAQECQRGGATIINMSLGGSSSSSSEERIFASLRAGGVLSIAAAGNDGRGAISFPASYPSVISVAAIDDTYQRAYFSNSNNQVDISGPGVDILSTFPPAPNGYRMLDGTSMACPHVVGVAALLQAYNSSLSVDEIEYAMYLSARPLPTPTSTRNDEYGHGLVQAYDALQLVKQGVPPRPPSPPPTPYPTVTPKLCPGRPSPDEGELCLFDGPSEASGRLEIFYRGVWGTVCDDFFSNTDASVACRQLGFTGFGATYRTWGGGTGNIWLDDVNCVGTESRLIDCPANSIGSHNCGHYEDVGVNCAPVGAPVSMPAPFFRPSAPIIRGPTPPFFNPPRVCPTNPNPVDGDLCLFDGDSDKTGRLEVYFRGEWGTVCDDHFDGNDAAVACRQLGYNSEGAMFETIGNGVGTIWLDNLRCSGDEERLVDCPADPLGSHNCRHTEDVGLTCSDAKLCETNPDPVEGDLCLFDGTDETNGRLEIFYEGVWGTVCDDFFRTVSANVACRQLGFRDVGSSFQTVKVAGRGQIWLDNVMCRGDELFLANCTNNGWGVNNCLHTEDIALMCSASPVPSWMPSSSPSDVPTVAPAPKMCPTNLNPNEGDLCLFDGATDMEGRLEIYTNGAWGTVCENDFGTKDAAIACRQLGFGLEGASFNTVDNGFGPIWLDNVECIGAESRLVDCPASVGNNTCQHTQDVAISCPPLPVLASGNITCSVGGIAYSVEIQTDPWSLDELSLELRNNTGTVLWEAASFLPNQNYVFYGCFRVAACLELVVMDSAGDGMCCGGNVRVNTNTGELGAVSGAFGSQSSISIGFCSTPVSTP